MKGSNSINVVSLFHGCGGLDLGFKRQGYNIIWAIDFNKAACQTYRNNIGEHVICEDIKNVDSSVIPDCDIIIGGSPCQGFSNSNRHTHYLDNPKNFLVKEYIRIVKDKQPLIFVLENVPQLLSCGNGQFIDEIKFQLKDYDINYKVLCAADYNVPQLRRRTIVIGSKIGKINHPHGYTTQYRTVADAFKGLNNTIPNQLDYTHSKQGTIERMKYIPQGGNFTSLPIEFQDSRMHSDIFRRLDYSKPSVTIANPRKQLLLHPTENRIVSVRECARIQSFPDDFIFYGNLSDKQQQVADAVPPLLSEAIAKQIKEYIIQNKFWVA